jgi:tRNA modification GTPase
MYQYKGGEDTIAAIATPCGQGGIGIIRLSGADALRIADGMFKAKGTRRPSQFRNFSVRYGWIVRQCAGGAPVTIDEVLLTVMRAPQSYTREDVVEMSCHGGAIVLRAILNLCLDFGARLADPGEFTKRAFLNGRIDLTRAEAVLDVIRARTDAFLRVSTLQMTGELSQELTMIRERLMLVYTQCEAIVNFPDDDVDVGGRLQIHSALESARQRTARLLATADQGRLLKEGMRIVLCGKPNVGKSSLLNVLLKHPRAIVSPVAGTTRDTIEETAQIKGIPLQLVDTAGILEPRDLIEEEAIRRSHSSMQSADLVLLILDGSRPLSQEDQRIIEHLGGQNFLVVINKGDLEDRLGDFPAALSGKPVLRVSATEKAGIDRLEDMIVALVTEGKEIDSHRLMISNLRHIRCLKECSVEITWAMDGLSNAVPLELISEAVKRAVNILDAITGRNIDEDLLDQIFSEFCIGK